MWSFCDKQGDPNRFWKPGRGQNGSMVAQIMCKTLERYMIDESASATVMFYF
jgi:hypothetical protein